MRHLDFEPMRTLPKIVSTRAISHPTEIALQQWTGGNVKKRTWADYAQAVTEIGLSLAASGVQRGDRAAIISSTDMISAVDAAVRRASGNMSRNLPTSSVFDVRQILPQREAMEDPEAFAASLEVGTVDDPAVRFCTSGTTGALKE